MLALLTEFDRRCSTPSDINEHLPLLHHYAEYCDTVAEFGVRQGNSSWALALGLYKQKGFLHQYDKDETCKQITQALVKAGVYASFTCADTRRVIIPEVDMLFIDTYHTGACLREELKNSNRVRRYIAMHDTVTYGFNGENGIPGDGLNKEIQWFLNYNPQWTVAEIRSNNNGLMILQRIGQDASVAP